MKKYRLAIKIHKADVMLEYNNLELNQAIEKLSCVANGFVLNLENLSLDEVSIVAEKV